MSTPEVKWIDGGVCAPADFWAGAASCGLKSSGLDIALLASGHPCVAAGVFTTNALPGWPVVLSREVVRRRTPVAGIVVNSGVSNVATGEQGLSVAREMCALAAGVFRSRWPNAPDAVLIAQTGVIGEVPDLGKIRAGIAASAAALSENGDAEFATAILTTDTCPKSVALEVEGDGFRFRLGGAAKGAGMIAPRMATMLAFLTTDVGISPALASAMLTEAAERSFNRITVDSDTSTSDSVFLLANGAAGVSVDDAPHGVLEAFRTALTSVCEELAKRLVRDAEGATRIGRIIVSGAASDGDADAAARAVAESPLVKCALFGGDPNWGRIWMAVGKSGACVDPSAVSIAVAGVTVLERGTPVPDAKRRAATAMAQPEVLFEVDLGLGEGRASYWFSDLSYDYVRVNAEYHT